MPDSALDVGFSLQLKRLAEAAGDSEAARVAYLLADTTQRALELAFKASAASSLPVERAFAQTKRNEAPRLCHVSVASRNQLLRNFLREREALLAPLQEAEAALRKATKLRIQSLAWQQRSELVGRALGCVALEKKQQKALVKAHDASAMLDYVENHKSALLQQVAAIRQEAQSQVEAARQMTKGPLTAGEWMEWFTTHRDTFVSNMQTATKQRRALCQRLNVAPGAPVAAAAGVRFAPESASAATSAGKHWTQVLRGRDGWFAVQTVERNVKTLYLYSRGSRTYALDFDRCRVSATSFTLCGDVESFDVSRLVNPLSEVQLAGAFGQCIELVVTAQASLGQVTFSVAHAQPVHAPLPRRARESAKTKTAGDLPQETDSSASEFEKEDVQDALSQSSGCFSVDTDVDDVVDSAKKPACCEAGESDSSEASGARASPAEAGGAGSAEDGGDAGDEAAAVRAGPAYRHPPGTWKEWENQWFYITQTPGWTDVKCHMKTPFRNCLDGMGWFGNFTKTMSPHMFGETVLEPTRTFLLLRAWAIWRVRLGAWHREREGRSREVERQVARLTADIIAAASTPREPLLGSAEAQALLRKWLPDVAAAVVAAPL